MLLVRHGQSEFNVIYSVTRVDPGIPDPSLTELGRDQAAAAAKAVAGLGLRRLIASPYTRTLQTAAIVAEALGLAVEVDARVRERAAFACDIGSAPADLKARFPSLRFDHLDHPWWHDHVGLGAPETEATLAERAAAFCRETAERDDWRHTLVVTHWGFIRAVAGRTAVNGEIVPIDLAEAVERRTGRNT